jgi:DNA-binding MarR family transcriptional regulator
MQRALAGQSITAAQFMALSHISNHPGINRADLGRALQVTPQAASGVIKQLAERGLIDRTMSQPGLALALRLTPAGRAALGQAVPTVAALDRQLLLRCVGANAIASMDGAFRHVFNRLSPDRRPEPAGPRLL